MGTENRSEDQMSRNNTLNSLLKGLCTQGGEEVTEERVCQELGCTHFGLRVVSS